MDHNRVRRSDRTLDGLVVLFGMALVVTSGLSLFSELSWWMVAIMVCGALLALGVLAQEVVNGLTRDRMILK
ncbi:hypothetical protein MOQ72_42225 [Saccharopolyspora sp. K220]|uniref:hypothetical protein n=1 Tax=Saccharopolyspora soli TaxID=2926618 RepID=UPI001F5761A8|nr:hypothetical protein [Saccharopolyspora soli]MCI2424036.1 hypothetical protein [Saccharopolyspora soli]